MKAVKRFFKIIGALLLALLVLIIVAGTLFLNFSPQFGGSASNDKKLLYSRSSQYQDGVFVNAIPTSLDMGFRATAKIAYKFFFNREEMLEPSQSLPFKKIDPVTLAMQGKGLKRITWLGHSACLLEIDGKRILFDPMLGPSPAPHPWLGPKRFSSLPLTLDEMPRIDVVVISHDHYDHLDYESIVKLSKKTTHFYTPIGVGTHLEEWGIEPGKITELDWWEQSTADGFTFVCTPARHFSGRGVFDRFATLWASWIVKTENTNIYFSGDGGYGPHFSEIGQRYGPFDFAMLECGQYNELWKDIHMMPEETVQAAKDLKAKAMMPIHWGAFALAMHTWMDPIERVTVAAQEENMPIATPIIGEPISLDASQFPDKKWWK